jgi:gliding motility-associated-like protein
LWKLNLLKITKQQHMKKMIILYICFSFFHKIKAQLNLVPNGSFEDTVVCTDVSVNISAIKNWFIPLKDTVNENQLCKYLAWWRFLDSRKIGINNSQCGYIETYYRGFPDDFIYSGRVYLAVKLSETLKAGQQYYFEMQTRCVDTFPNYQLVNTVFSNGQEVAFVKEQPLFNVDLSRNYLRIIPKFRGALHQDYDWHKVNGCFTADGNEKYMIIGNFNPDENTQTKVTGKRNNNFPNGLTAYHAIDNVILTPMTIDLRDTALCIGDTLRLDVKKTIPESVSYKWHTGETTSQYFGSKSENIDVTIEYTDKCEVSKSIKSNFITPDYQPISQDTLICLGQSLTFTAGAGLKNESIKWENGSIKRTFSASNAGLYTAQIKSQCANWIDSFRLRTRDCGEGLFMPNAFSPNEDGENDVFKPFFRSDFAPINSYSFSVFNRWGSLLFQTNDIDKAWDGTYRGEKLSVDMYVWVLNIEYVKKEKPTVLTLGGDVLLMR